MSRNHNPFGHYPETALFKIGNTLDVGDGKTALIVMVKEGQPLDDFNAKLHLYLLDCHPIAKQDGYSGFAFEEGYSPPELKPTIH
ncbi:MAG: hypothetical protein DRJ07_15865 [Bacteroidetes bacterium]|nr:MAG: hypothetical protein DRJ07_15865 [Bacteroidota bacterium]